MKKFMKQFLIMAACVCLFSYGTGVQAAETTETAEQQETQSALGFTIGTFEYEITLNTRQEDLPVGFTLGEWEYNGQKVPAGFTENSDMVCVMADDKESGYNYRFIYDPAHEMFAPYFGAEINGGYIYTIPLYEGMEVPYGFHEAYFVIQTVPMFVFQRDDMELTTEEIALGVLSEDAYLVFPMMNDQGEEICYTYDLVDRTFQRAMLQERDAEKVTEVNETADKLHQDISTLNADSTKRMNQRLTIIGILTAIVFIMTGVIVNMTLKISKLKKQLPARDDDDFMDGDDEERSGSASRFRVRKNVSDEYDEYDEYGEEDDDSAEWDEEDENPESEAEDDLEILDLDEMDD